MKKFLILLIAVLSLSLAGCDIVDEGGGSGSGSQAGETEDRINGFDVPALQEVAFGSAFQLPVFVVTDSGDNVCAVECTVKNGEEEVAVVAGKISIDKMTDYTVVYTVNANGKVHEKTLVLKVKDETEPFIEIEEMKNCYVADEEIALPGITVRDNVDADLPCRIEIRKGEEVIVENVGKTFKLSEEGLYTLVATATDKARNEGKAEAGFTVRRQPLKGEIELLEDRLSLNCITAISTYGENIVKGFDEKDGKKAVYIRSVVKDDETAIAKYPGLCICPRITKAQAEELKAQGFDTLTVEFYLDHTAKRAVYHKWAEDGKQSPALYIENGKWTTMSFDLDLFLQAYDRIASGETMFLYLGNEVYIKDGVIQYGPPDKTEADFRFFISSVFVTKAIEDLEFADKEMTALPGDEIDVSSLVASTGEETGLAYRYYAPDGREIKPENGKITLPSAGIYRVVAVPAERCYTGSAELAIVVKASAEEINGVIAEILSAEDITAMTERAETLKILYSTLSEAEKAEINPWQYIAASELIAERDDELFYFDTKGGREQVTIEYNIPTAEGYVPVTTKAGITFTADEKYGDEAGSTKFAFSDVPNEWFMPYTIRLSLPSDADLTPYSFIRFYMKGYSWSGNRPLCYNVAVNGKRISTTAGPVVLATGEWQEAIIPLNEVTGDFREVTINFSSRNNGDVWGSLWNDPTRMYVNISGFRLGKSADDIVLDEKFVKKDIYSVGEEVSLADFKVSSAAYPGAEYRYYVIMPDGTEAEMGTALAMTVSGDYILCADMINCDLVKGEYRLTLTAKKTPEEVRTQIEELKKLDFGSEEFNLLAEKVRADFILLDEEDKKAIGEFDLYALIKGVAVEDSNKLYYFDSAVGPDEVSIAYNQDIAINSKKGIVFDSEVKYGNEAGSLKVDFSASPDEWFCPYILKLNLPQKTDISEYQYIVFRLRAHTWNAGRPMTYTLKCDGKYINNTNATVLLESETWQEVRIPASEISDITKLDIRFYTKNGNDCWGSVWNDPTRIYVNISDVYGIKAVEDLAFEENFGKENEYALNSTISLAEMSAKSPSLNFVADVYNVKTPSGDVVSLKDKTELVLDKEGVYVFEAICDAEGYYGRATKEITVKDMSDTKVYFAKNTSSCDEIMPVGYGTDKVVVTFLDEFEGEKNVVKASTSVDDGANKNSYKWPGISLKARMDAAQLEEAKEEGYTKVIMPLYISGTKTLNIKYGKGDSLITAVNPGQWNYVEISIDKMISYNSDEISYFMYIDNGASGEYITYYVGGIYLEK